MTAGQPPRFEIHVEKARYHRRRFYWTFVDADGAVLAVGMAENQNARGRTAEQRRDDCRRALSDFLTALQAAGYDGAGQGVQYLVEDLTA